MNRMSLIVLITVLATVSVLYIFSGDSTGVDYNVFCAPNSNKAPTSGEPATDSGKLGWQTGEKEMILWTCADKNHLLWCPDGTRGLKRPRGGVLYFGCRNVKKDVTCKTNNCKTPTTLTEDWEQTCGSSGNPNPAYPSYEAREACRMQLAEKWCSKNPTATNSDCAAACDKSGTKYSNAPHWSCTVQ